MKRVVTTIVTCVLLLSILCSTAFAINYDISFKLEPNGPSQYDGHGRKGDRETRCYITTTGGTAVTNGLTYKMRGKNVIRGVAGIPSYSSATQLGTYSGKITSRTLNYISPYSGYIQNNDLDAYEWALAASLHSGTGSSYTITGRWNP